MIAHAQPQSSNPSAHYLHAKFLELLPSIEKHARVAFRSRLPERREELVAEAVANCWAAFVRLMQRGLEHVIYAGPLAQFAIKQVRRGRRVGNKLNIRDITSRHCQVIKGVRVGSLDHYNEDAEEWKEAVVEDKHAGPAAVAATRIDFAAWLGLLPARLRKIAKLLATGESTGVTAKRYKVSSGQISQIRGELRKSWEAFQGHQQAELNTV